MRCKAQHGWLSTNGLVDFERFLGLSSKGSIAEERHCILLPRGIKSGYKTVNVKSAKVANP